MPRHFTNEKKEKKEKKRIVTRKRACRFCTHKDQPIDYKLTGLLKAYITESGKINARRNTGNCSFHQRRVVDAINRARTLALLPYCLIHAVA